MDINDNNHISSEEDIEQIARALIKDSNTSPIVTIRYFKDESSNEPDIRFRRFNSIPLMEQRGLLEIILPILKSSYRKSLDPNDMEIVEYDVYKVKTYPNKLVNSLHNLHHDNKQLDIPLENKKPPEKWDLKEDEKQAHITRNNAVVFTFPRIWAQKYKYFKCLWNHYNQYVQYKTIYESEQNHHYPEKGVTSTNGNIRNVFGKLEKEMKNNSLPVSIEISKGVKLTFIN